MQCATQNPNQTFARVRTSARLHLGFLNPGMGGRRFGGLGMALDTPRLEVTLARAETTRADGEDAERGLAYLRAIAARLRIATDHRLRIAAALPAHAGLGSGTQLALAIAAALRALHGLQQDPRADSATLDRGGRSGIGVALFAQGGFVVDGGHARDSGGAYPPPLLARLSFPEPWRIILLLDPAHQGLSGPDERRAFAALPDFPQAASAEICRLTLLTILPALAERDLPNFGAGIAEAQAILGDHFAPAQGGRFTSARVTRGLARLARAGAVGIGQSSWGPTGFAFVPDDDADRILGETAADIAGDGLDMRLCRGLNHGASIRASDGDTIARSPQ